MAFTLGGLFTSLLLFVNAMAILNEHRFLNKVGWVQEAGQFGEEGGIKRNMIALLHAVRTLMRIPLIFINAATIVLKLILG